MTGWWRKFNEGPWTRAEKKTLLGLLAVASQSWKPGFQHDLAQATDCQERGDRIGVMLYVSKWLVECPFGAAPGPIIDYGEDHREPSPVKWQIWPRYRF
jgi:hypothetical protein